METNRYQSTQARYQALRSRDAQAVGYFFYGVLSTGIYCHPNCASRQPREENIRFFDTAIMAVQAGFRACKRCQPERNEQDSHINSKVKTICRMIEEDMVSPTLAQLSDATGWSASYLQRVFKAVMGVSPKGYARHIRMQRVKQGLSSSLTMTQVVFQAGFSSTGHYYSEARKMGVLSSKKSTLAVLIIHYRVVSTALGFCLVAATEKGICAVSLGGEQDTLVKELQMQFSNATLININSLKVDQGGTYWQSWFDSVIAEVESSSSHLMDLPLDIQGTVFQQQVWQTLRSIPRGETRSYSEIAEVIGKPNAVRAVATACASNKIALLIPCHRVVRKGGLLAGYRWGLERKETLLKRESYSKEKHADPSAH